MGNSIMAHDDRITLLTLEAQKRVFRLAIRDHDHTLNSISLDSNIPYNTIRSYASGGTAMPLPALSKLCDVIPDYLLSQLLVRSDRQIVPTSDSIDFDQLGRECMAYSSELAEAHSPDSPGGTEIVEVEAQSLKRRVPKVAV
jgi:hypothetical protein